MKAEIIAVGTELLLGQITNTNAQYLSQQLASIGIDVYYQTVVGDNQSRLLDALDLAYNRADIVICTGGIGPTQDDITKDVLAHYADKTLMMHPPSLEKIEQYFIDRNTKMLKSNARQALIIKDSEPFMNDVGMAVGLALKYDQTSFIILPGPPREMKYMFEHYTKDWLLNQLTTEVPLFSKTLKFAGIGESSLEDRLKDLIDAQEDPTIAPYAKEGEVAIRLTTRAQDAVEGSAKLETIEQVIYERLGKYIFAETDISLEQALVKLMTEKKLTVATAESCTGGMLSDLLTSIPGSAEVFPGGIVTYSNAFKHKYLNVPAEIFEGENAPGAISAEAARLMAEGLLAQSDTDFAVSITGIAGPSTMENKPVGLVYVGIASKDRETQVEEVRYPGNREIIRLRSCKLALYKLWTCIKEKQ